MGRWLCGGVVLAALTFAGDRVSEAPATAVFESIPGAARVEVRVGERLQFAVSAEAATAFTWTLNQTPVSHEGAWAYVPTPEDVGERLVTVVVSGEAARPEARTWQVIVQPIAAPELVEVTPRPGSVTVAANTPATFRCRARVAGARRTDRLRFQWTVNGHPVHTDERKAAEGLSELPLATAEPGEHEVMLRIATDDRVATTVSWKVAIAPPPPPGVHPALGDEFDPMPSRDEPPPVAIVAAAADEADAADLGTDADGEAVLERIDVDDGPDPAVRLQLSAHAAAHARTLPAQGDTPSRIYVDLPHTRLARTAAGSVAGRGPIVRVRSGQFDASTTRVVLELAGPLPFDLRRDGRAVVLALAPPTRMVRATTAAQTPHPSPAPERLARTEPATPPAPVRAEHTPPPVAAIPAPAPPVDDALAQAPPVVAVPPASAPAAPKTVVAEPAPPEPDVAAPRIAASEPAVVDEPRAAAPPTVAEAPPAATGPTLAETAPVVVEPTVAEAPPVAAAPTLDDAPPASPPSGAHAPTEVATTPAVAAPQPTVAALESSPSEPATAPAPPSPELAAPPSAPPASDALASSLPPAGAALPVVVVDAGHGGRDPGAAGVGGVLEKDVVLEIAQRLAVLLPARLPVNVVMTRSDDSFVAIDARLAIAGEDALLFLSLHANACADPTPRGVEVFYGGGHLRTAATRSQDPRAALLGRCLTDALSALAPVRHAQPGPFGVLVRNPLPSALVEIGYLTTPEDAAHAQDAAYQDRFANALADAVAAFLRASAPPL